MEKLCTAPIARWTTIRFGTRCAVIFAGRGTAISPSTRTLQHHLTAADYRGRAGLNCTTRLITPTMEEQLRQTSAPVIARLRAEGKLRRWDEDPEKWQHDKAAAVDVLHEGLRREGSQNRSAGFTADRRQDRAERTRAHNLSGELRADPQRLCRLR